MGVGRAKCGFGAKKGVADQGKTCVDRKIAFSSKPFSETVENQSKFDGFGVRFRASCIGNVFSKQCTNQSNIDGFAVVRQKFVKM